MMRTSIWAMKNMPCRNTGNSRNGKTSKTIKSKYGAVEIAVPRDRASTFDPVVVPKRSSQVENIEELVIFLYANGISTGDSKKQLREIYQFNLLESAISNITSKMGFQ